MVRCLNVLLVAPRFPEHSFWNNKALSRVAGSRTLAIPLGLLTVAALLPAAWSLRLVDRNCSELTEADLDAADLVLTGGMNVQGPDILEIIALVQRRGKPVVVGGPGPTSEPEFFADADFLVLGEAEEIIGDFVAAWEAGQRSGRFTAEKFKADITKTPVPRYDLLNRADYTYHSVQFSRGCPFTCEFCDIIELYGRRPRVKTPEQVLHELDTLYEAGFRGHIDFVDDNFIGNKKAVKAFLPHLVAWQKQRGYPLHFSTEASINLADDDELLALMREAGFFVVFVGIESPDSKTLMAMSKKQNTRRELTDSVHRIYAAGLFVIAGFIVGFDSEEGSVAGFMVEAIEDAAIPVAMVGLLTALANTQLTTRLRKEGRLYSAEWYARLWDKDGGDQCTIGLNFTTLRPRRDVLADYLEVIERIYTPSAYFGRLERVARRLDRFAPPRVEAPEAGAVPAPGFLGIGRDDWMALRRLLEIVLREQPTLLFHVVRVLYRCARTNPGALHSVATQVAFYLHLGPFSRFVSKSIRRQIRDIDSGRWQAPAPETAVVGAESRKRDLIRSIAST